MLKFLKTMDVVIAEEEITEVVVEVVMAEDVTAEEEMVEEETEVVMVEDVMNLQLKEPKVETENVLEIEMTEVEKEDVIVNHLKKDQEEEVLLIIQKVFLKKQNVQEEVN